MSVPDALRGPVLRDMLSTRTAYTDEGETIELRSNLPAVSALKLQQLVAEHRPARTLEVGFAMGVSALAILYGASEHRHTAIDLTQRRRWPDGWSGAGLEMVERAGFGDRFEYVEGFSHEAMPRLLAGGRKFDLIFIDSWHSFDVTFVEFFYADLMLNDGGLLILDDVHLPGVHLVCDFIETHKDYERLGPALRPPLHPLAQLRAAWATRRRRDDEWGGMQGYRKLRPRYVDWDFQDSAFYPYYRWSQLLRRARSLVRRPKPS